MALTTRDRQQIYTRLAPVIGEEEAETLLDQFPSTADTRFATIADLQAVEARLDHRIDLLDAKIDLVEARLSARFDVLEKSFEATLHKALRRQTIWMIATIVTVLGLAARTNIFG